MSPASMTVQKYKSMGKFMHEDPDSVFILTAVVGNATA